MFQRKESTPRGEVLAGLLGDWFGWFSWRIKNPPAFQPVGFKNPVVSLRRICTPTAAAASDHAGRTTPGSRIVRAIHAHTRRLGLRFNMHRTRLLYAAALCRQRKKEITEETVIGEDAGKLRGADFPV